MTIKHETCPQCNNRGIVRRYIFDTEQFRFVRQPLPIVPPMNGKIQEEYCNCSWGFEKKGLTKKTESPDWVNPLEGLSDEQILDWMDRAHENQQAIEQEFE